jgi:thiol:disulfide interchange protein DsbC
MLNFDERFDMKKFCAFSLSVLALGGYLAAGEFEDNLIAVANKAFGEQFRVVSVDNISAAPCLRMAVLQNKDGNAMPLFVTADGKSFNAWSRFFHLDDPKDLENLNKRMQEVKQMNEEAEAKAKAKVDDALGELLDSFGADAYVYLKGPKDATKLITIITDPDCPYCRQEMKGLRERLKSADVRLIFAPVHPEEAYIKSALIMKETKELKDEDKVIAVLEKYYDPEVKVSPEQAKSVNTKSLHDNANKIFASGAVRGVPYLHQAELKK